VDRGDDTGADARRAAERGWLTWLPGVHNLPGRDQTELPREGPAAPDAAGSRHRLCTLQGQRGLGGAEQDGRLVRGLPEPVLLP
jgi:hypothetical protein